MANAAEPTPISALLRPGAATSVPNPAQGGGPGQRPGLRLAEFLAPTEEPAAEPSEQAPARPAPAGPTSAWPRALGAAAAASAAGTAAAALRAPSPPPASAPVIATDEAAASAGSPVPSGDLPKAHLYQEPVLPEVAPPPGPSASALVPIVPVIPATPVLASSTDLTHDQLVQNRRDRPTSGWRAALYACTGGWINPGLSQHDRTLAELHAAIRAPLRGVGYRIAVIGGKGGVGRTTVAAALAATLAEVRGDQVVAVDAAPEAGTLADRLVGPPSVTIRELLHRITNSARPPTLPELDSYLRLSGRLRVLASQQDPASCTSLTPDEYEQVLLLLARHLSIAVTDCSAGIAHPVTGSVLQAADSLVVVGTLTVDGASRAAHTLDWLAHHGYEVRARESVVVLTGDNRSRDIDLNAVRNHFAGRARALVEIPYDPHLAAGGRLERDQLRRPTSDAITRLAAAVAGQFARPLALTE